jgi:8-amino-7-oxononanoate synthase
MNRVERYLEAKLNERITAGNLRQLNTQRAPIDFFSNDYLGLATSGALVNAPGMPDFANGTGATGSRLLSGNSPQTEELEYTIAAFHKAEAALLFNSGYDANTGLIACIANRHTVILSDELCHASIIDGVRLSQCKHKHKFRHNDINDLEGKLRKCTDAESVVVIIESVYSMDGDMAQLEIIVELCERYSAQLIVDEAHATGVIGSRGEGLVCALGLQDKVFARVHTFGKALGCHGAAVAGGNLLKQYLINFARSFIYTTALPGHSVQAIANAYHYLSGREFTNSGLHQLIAYFRQRIATSGMRGWKDSVSPIQALVTGSNEASKRFAGHLISAGLQVSPILHPTVPLGMERLRVCLHTFNTREEVDLLFDSLQPGRL